MTLCPRRAPSWLNFTSQLAALVIVQVAVLAATVVSGMVQQAAQGYFRFEVALYLKEFFLIELSALILFAVFAIFLQTILPNKFLGHTVVIGVFLGPSLLAELMDQWNVTIPAGLYNFAFNPDYTYSA
jgi:ABC-2 type transport system permease protein